MSTSTITQSRYSVPTDSRHSVLGLLLCMAIPPALLGLANWFGDAVGIVPLFFAPFGLPGWIGAAVYVGSLPLYGAAWHLVSREARSGQIAARWISLLVAATLLFPFVIAPLDSFQLSLVAVVLAVLGIGATLHAAAVSPLAGWIMAPATLWMGFSAVLGMSFTANWSPPFAPTNPHNSL